MATIDASFVQGDTGPDMAATIHVSGDPTTPINLTNATVRFQMRKSDDVDFTVDAVATVVVAASGTVKYLWAANDLAVPGEYDAQWEITFADAMILSTSLLGAAETAVVVTQAIASETFASGSLRVQLDSGAYRDQTYTSWSGSTFVIPATDYSVLTATQPRAILVVGKVQTTAAANRILVRRQ